MLKFNTYATSLVSMYPTLSELIHEHAPGIDHDNPYVSSEAVNVALSDPDAYHLRRNVALIGNYVKAFRELRVVRSDLQSQLDYLADALPALEVQRDNIVGKRKAEISALIKKMQQRFLSLLELRQRILHAITELDRKFDEVIFLSEVIDEDWSRFREETCKTMVDTLVKHGVQLSNNQIKQFQTKCSWGELVQLVRKSNIELPSQIDLDNPTYNTHFALKGYLILTHVLRSELAAEE